MLTLSEQYKHELWTRKSNEIKARDNDTCLVCGDKTHRHDVHHLCYFPDLHIWEYDNELLITVCRTHHEILNLELPKLAGLIAFKILTSEIDPNNIDWLIDLLKEVKNGSNKNG